MLSETLDEGCEVTVTYLHTTEGGLAGSTVIYYIQLLINSRYFIIIIIIILHEEIIPAR